MRWMVRLEVRDARVKRGVVDGRGEGCLHLGDLQGLVRAAAWRARWGWGGWANQMASILC